MKSKEFFQSFENDPEYQHEKGKLRLRLSLADQILDLRLKKGYSQKKLAEMVGTKQANISRLESGLANPTLSLLEKIASALEVEFEIRFIPLSIVPPFSDATGGTFENDESSIGMENWPSKKEECVYS